MAKKVVVFLIILLLGFQGAAFAQGDVVFTDAFYGAAIGGLLGTAIYLIDQDDFAVKFGAGVLIGTLGGIMYGLSESRSFAEVKDGEIKLAVPTLDIDKRGEGVLYQAELVRVVF
ncbi:MAG: hypothetical protein Kow0025_11250 [Thermodesulfovibrionales bacterium]